MATVGTVNAYPLGVEQTSKSYIIKGTFAITGTYTNGMGSAVDFTAMVSPNGDKFRLPATYANTVKPNFIDIQSSLGYAFVYDPVNLSIRIYNGITELSTATVPAGISGAGVPFRAEFPRG